MSNNIECLEEVKADAVRLTQKRIDDFNAELEAGRKRDEAEAQAPKAKKESK